jgi:hypothetical protein
MMNCKLIKAMTAILLSSLSPLICSSHASAAEVHAYKVERVAATAEQCAEVESWLIPRFATLAEAKVLNHGCERNPRRTYDLVIEYAKPVEVSLVTTMDEYAHVNALYETAEICNADINPALETFKAATGLEPLIAYCHREYLDPEVDNGWAMRIDGFGKPRLSPQHLSRDFYNGIHGDVNALESSLKNTLEAFGASNAKVRIRASSNRAILHAMYYAPKRLPILQYGTAQFKNLATCEKNREELEAVFAAAGGRSAIFFCGGSRYTATVYMYTAGVVVEPLATDLTKVKYDTMEACESKREHTETSWRDGLEKNVVGSICAIEDAVTYDYVRMRMFWID